MITVFHQQMAEMILEIDKLLVNNNIHYVLLGGSVLGAVRHQGFIPWDDDMDIGIFRKDFEKAESLLSNLKNYRYEFSEKHDIPDAPVGHLRFVERTNLNDYSGTIDVFALDYVPRNKFERKFFHFFSKVYHLCVLRRPPMNRGDFTKFVVSFFYFIFPDSLLDLLQRASKKQILNSKYMSSGIVGNLFGAWGEKEYFNEVMYQQIIYRDFEGMSLPIPADHHAYLTQLYGDYMELPPKEKQVPKHS